jgi:hypothetical protein
MISESCPPCPGIRKLLELKREMSQLYQQAGAPADTAPQQ